MEHTDEANDEDLCTKKEEFENWLLNKVSRQSSMVSRSQGEKIIEYLRDQRDKGPDSDEVRSTYTAAFRFTVKKRKFVLMNVVGLGDILCLPTKDRSKATHSMLGHHRQVIFKEDMFGVIENAHKNNDRHRGYKGTFNKLMTSYCNIPREVVHKYVSMCKFCQKSHACFIPLNMMKKQKKQQKKNEMAFLTRCQVDILELQGFSESDEFTHMGHFYDYHTKYNILFPLKQTDANYVADQLCQYCFSHFGLPRILYTNNSREFTDDLISAVMKQWSTDSVICSGNPNKKSSAEEMQSRQRTIMALLETMKAKDKVIGSKWPSLLPGIQYSMNTNVFDSEGDPPAYDLVFSRKPRIYPFSEDSKTVLREEDMFVELSDMDDDAVEITEEQTKSVNESLAVSVDNLVDPGDSNIVLNQPQDDLHLQQNKDLSPLKQQEDHNILQVPLLSNISLSAIPVTLGDDQYTIIGTLVTPEGQTVQIPIVNIGNNTLTITGDATAQVAENVIDNSSLNKSNDITINLNHPQNLNNMNTAISSKVGRILNLTSQDSASILANQNTEVMSVSQSDVDSLEFQGESAPNITITHGHIGSIDLSNQNIPAVSLASQHVADIVTRHIGNVELSRQSIQTITTANENIVTIDLPKESNNVTGNLGYENLGISANEIKYEIA